MEAARAGGYSDVVMLHEHRGEPGANTRIHDGIVAVGIFGVRDKLTRPFRDARRFPSTRL
jgi:rRNA maturation protein Rpf1